MRTYQAIEVMEKLRKKYSIYSKGVILAMLIFLVPVIVSMVSPTAVEGIMFLPFLVMPLVLISAIASSKVQKEFNNIYKEVFAKAAIDEVLEGATYDWKRGFSEAQVDRFKIVRMGNRFSSEDYLRATHKGVEFEQSDVTVKRVVKTKNGTSTTIYFKGRMINFHAAVKDVMDLQIFSENFGYRAHAGLKMNKIELEDVDFNKRFDVFSANEHEAFYVLTPQFMERLKQLQDRYISVGMHFRGDNIYIAFKTDRNCFDADMRREVNFPQEMARMHADIQDIFDIIEDLGLGKEE